MHRIQRNTQYGGHYTIIQYLPIRRWGTKASTRCRCSIHSLGRISLWGSIVTTRCAIGITRRGHTRRGAAPTAVSSTEPSATGWGPTAATSASAATPTTTQCLNHRRVGTIHCVSTKLTPQFNTIEERGFLQCVGQNNEIYLGSTDISHFYPRFHPLWTDLCTLLSIGKNMICKFWIASTNHAYSTYRLQTYLHRAIHIILSLVQNTSVYTSTFQLNRDCSSLCIMQ